MEYGISPERINDVLSKFKGVRFVLNGRDLNQGVDCVGFAILFYKELGIDIPLNDIGPVEKYWYKKEPNRMKNAIKSLNKREISLNSLQPLDLVYFAINPKFISHIGVMISNKEFAHMSFKRDLLISKFQYHWQRRFRGAIRLTE